MKKKILEYWKEDKCKHKPIYLPKGYGVITGGNDAPTNISLFISLDTARFNPFDTIVDSYGVIREDIRQICFPIADLGIPSIGKVKYFEQVLTVMHSYLQDKQNVHVNCFGGHGRTGLLLGCYLGKYFKDLVESDPVKYLRSVYCDLAVETFTQHDFIADYTGTKEAKKSEYFQENYNYKTSGKWKNPYKELDNALSVYQDKIIASANSPGKCRICEIDSDNRIFLSNVGLICQFCWHDLCKMNDYDKGEDNERYSG